MRRAEVEAAARVVVGAAAAVLGVAAVDAWDAFVGRPGQGPDPGRRAAGQPPPEVMLVRAAAVVALVGRGVPYAAACLAVGASRPKQAGAAAESGCLAAVAARLARTAPALLAAATAAAEAAVPAPPGPRPTARQARAAARDLAAREMAAAGVDAATMADRLDPRGAAVRRRVALALVADRHSQRDVAAAMGWSPQAVSRWVRDTRGDDHPAC